MNRKRRRVSKSFEGVEPKTRQSDRTLTDIARIKRAGIVPPDPSQLAFADVSESFSYHEAMNQCARIEESFDALPSEVRYQFRNDPALLMEFVRDPENREAAVKLGLLSKPEDKPQPVDNKPVMENKPDNKPAVEPENSQPADKQQVK